MHRRDFGSFHSSNVEELVNLPEDEYIPPEKPFEFPSFEDYRQTPLDFGCSARKRHFLLEDCTFLNHGAFGGVLKEAMEVAQKWQLYTERQPLRTIDRELIPHLAHVMRRLASFVGCSPSELVLVNNVTSAMNAVLQNFPFKPGDKIFCLTLAHGGVKKLLKHVCMQTGAVLQTETLQFPIQNKQQIIDLVGHKLDPGTKLAVFDHIPSATPFISPLEEIIPLCRKKGVPVLIDGAHSLGSLPLNLQQLSADYYVSNAHKWFCSPKGCAFLYVKTELQSQIHPAIISLGYGSGFHSEFVWQGLRDYSPFIALNTVIDFWQAVGPDHIRAYIYKLVRQAATMLAEKWSTGLAAPLDMFGPMALVRLPSVLYEDKEVNYGSAETIQNTLYHRYNIECSPRPIPTQEYKIKRYCPKGQYVHNPFLNPNEIEIFHSVIHLIASNNRALIHNQKAGGCVESEDAMKPWVCLRTVFHHVESEDAMKPWVPIKSVQGELYVRISAHIYNEMAEYSTLADAILEMTKEYGDKK